MACAQSRNVGALYTLHRGAYVPYILGAPEFVNQPFAGLFAGGVPPLTPLITKSDGPATAGPPAADVAQRFLECLHGEIVEGFSLLLYEGGTVRELVACAESRGVTALYALADGAWVSYILGAPDFVNRSFRELFADGVQAVTPLVAKGEGATRNRLRRWRRGGQLRCHAARCTVTAWLPSGGIVCPLRFR